MERITVERSAGLYSQRTYCAKSGFRTYSLATPRALKIGSVVPNMHRRMPALMRHFDPP